MFWCGRFHLLLFMNVWPVLYIIRLFYKYSLSHTLYFRVRLSECVVNMPADYFCTMYGCRSGMCHISSLKYARVFLIVAALWITLSAIEDTQ